MYGGIGGRPLNDEVVARRALRHAAGFDVRGIRDRAAHELAVHVLPLVDRRAEMELLQRLLREPQPDFGAIHLGAAGRRVVHVEVDVLPRQRRRADAVRMIVEAAPGHVGEQRREAADRAQAIGLLTRLTRDLHFGRQLCSVMRAVRRSSGTFLPEASVGNGWPSITSVPGGNVTRLTVM